MPVQIASSLRLPWTCGGSSSSAGAGPVAHDREDREAQHDDRDEGRDQDERPVQLARPRGASLVAGAGRQPRDRRAREQPPARPSSGRAARLTPRPPRTRPTAVRRSATPAFRGRGIEVAAPAPSSSGAGRPQPVPAQQPRHEPDDDRPDDREHPEDPGQRLDRQVEEHREHVVAAGQREDREERQDRGPDRRPERRLPRPVEQVVLARVMGDPPLDERPHGDQREQRARDDDARDERATG